MDIFVPEYYGHFQCLAAACPDSCCKEWEVDVDETSAAVYQALPGALGDRLRQVLRPYDGGICMTIENGRCPMWRQDGLCRIQAELGHDALCKICREYPRLRQDYGDFAELMLEMSCPEAARLIFASPGVCKQTEAGGTDAEYDPDAMSVLLQSREELLRFWEQTPLDADRALAVTLLFAHSVQGALDGGDYVPLEETALLQSAHRHAGTADASALRDFFLHLEILTDRWKKRLNAPVTGPWQRDPRSLVVYLIRRYWLQAVWDYDLVCRAKFLVTVCLLLRDLPGDLVENAQLFSKEIENDPDNLDAIFDGAYTAPALTDSNLLGLLLEE